MSGLHLFHFLRPGWLLIIPVVLLLWWWLSRRRSEVEIEGERMAPHLRAALSLNQGAASVLGPAELLAAAGILLAVAAA